MNKNIEEYNFTYADTWKKLPPEKLLEFQNVFSKKKSLTIPEAGIWLAITPNSVLKLIKKGVIIAYNVFGSRTVRVDVERTKESLDMLKQNSNLASIWHQGGVPNDNLSNS